MKVFLVQHGKAKNNELDAVRGLTEDGVEESIEMAKFLRERSNVKVDVIYHSTKKRAKETAEIFNKHLEVSGGIEEVEDLCPNDNVLIWAEKLLQEDKDVMLVGHMPYVQKLSAYLTSNSTDNWIINIKNSGVTCLEFSESSLWYIDWVVTPEMIK